MATVSEILDEVLGIHVIEHTDRRGEPLSGPLRAAARVSIDGLECQIHPETEVETEVWGWLRRLSTEDHVCGRYTRQASLGQRHADAVWCRDVGATRPEA
jgi:hypothetical protein